MYKKITESVCVLAGLIFMNFSVTGQKKVEMRTTEVSLRSQQVELRAGNRVDSAVTYAATGEKTEKTVYTRDAQGRVVQEETLNWANNGWVNDTKTTFTYDDNGDARTEIYKWESNDWEYQGWNTVLKPAKGIYGIRNNEFYCNDMPGVYCYFGFGFTVSGWSYRNEVSRNSKGNPTRIEFHAYQVSNPDNSYLAWNIQITYNDGNLPVLINALKGEDFYRAVKFEYDSNENVVLYENIWEDGSIGRNTFLYDVNNNLISSGTSTGTEDLSKKVYQIDNEGNKAVEKFYTYTAGHWYETHYTIYYPNSLAPTIIPDNNNPIGNNNQGGFDITANISENSIVEGSFIVKLPEGFTLDQDNTALMADFDDFDLIITPQENNSWLLEIKSKSTRSVALRTEDMAKALVHIAYTVDGNVKRGMYDITVHSIEFKTSAGNNILEPAITVSAQVERWGVSTETIGNNKIWVSGTNLFIRLEKAYTISIYTVMGQFFRRQTVNAGETIIPLSQGIYFIKIGETVQKVMVK
ncbi:MAG: T9SS type A sorting domain-containing protein [Tannerella sp.]|jgi:hypothetical protein|nr:T9SS type A sorting domain-containing protein [Tannerella sp.]